MKKVKVNDVGTFIAAIEDEIQHSSEGRYYHRLYVVLHTLKTGRCYESACIYNHSPVSIYNWIHRLTESGLAGLRKGERPGRPSVFLLNRKKNYMKMSYFLPVNSVTTRTFGMVHYCLIILKRTLVYIYEYVSVRIYSISWGSAYKDHAERQPNLTLKSKKNLKKIPEIVDRSLYRNLGAERSAFSKSYKSYSNLGGQGKSTSNHLSLNSTKSCFFWSSKYQNRSDPDTTIGYVQCRNFSSVFMLPSQPNPRKNSPDFGQCLISPCQRFKAFFYRVSESISKRVFATLLSRIQPYRKSLANYSAKNNTQSLFSSLNRSQKCCFKPVCTMGAT